MFWQYSSFGLRLTEITWHDPNRNEAFFPQFLDHLGDSGLAHQRGPDMECYRVLKGEGGLLSQKT